MAKGPLTVDMSDYGGFERVGNIGTALAQTDREITTKPGDIILYQGSSVSVTFSTGGFFTPGNGHPGAPEHQ